MNVEQPTLGERHLKLWQRREYDGNFVYVLEAPPLTPVKIGFTNDVMTRKMSLQTGCPYYLQIKYVVPASQTLETWLHRYLRTSRLCGEWFDGPEVAPALERVAEMAEAMVDAYHPSKPWPDFADYAKWIPMRIRRPEIRKGQRTSLGQRFVEPTPLTEEEKLANLRAHYLRPARPIEKRPY